MGIADIETILRRSLKWFVISVILAAAITGAVLSAFTDDLLEVYDRMALWNLLAMIAFLVAMINPVLHRGICGENVDLKNGAILCFAFAVMSMFTCLGVNEPTRPFLLNFGFIVPMMAGFAGGWRLSLPVTLISAAMQIVFFGPNEHTLASISVLIVSGAVSGLWPDRDTSEPGSINLYPVPLIIAFTAAVASFAALSNDMSLKDSLVNSLIYSLMPFALAGVLSTVGYELIIQFVTFRSDALRSRNDLQVAHDIQMSAVPKEFPGEGYVRFGSHMESAVEVGGDFYDVFGIKEGLIGMVMADVSGKGLPAALFMMRAQATIRANAMTGLPPHEILRRSNMELIQRNDVGQFVTVWVGILDTDTGLLTYSNAGHTPPYIRRSGGFGRMECNKGLVMGFSRKAKYVTESVELSDGDAIFLYTDGVNEAFDQDQEQYGQDRLASVLERSSSLGPQEIVDSVREDIRSFVGDAEMSDDITMLCMSADFGDRRHISCRSDKSLLNGIIDEIHGYLISEGCPEKDALKLDIVTEELFVNICNYSYENGDGPADIRYSIRDGVVEMTFEDSGIPFDPTGRGEVVLDEDISKWPIGGLGVHMSIKLTDSAHYKRIGGRNIFTVRKRVGKDRIS
ncbi:MAG: SpoIIE family protein phosphatase [Candidatus Methanomethylophilaceae archaeon]